MLFLVAYFTDCPLSLANTSFSLCFSREIVPQSIHIRVGFIESGIFDYMWPNVQTSAEYYRYKVVYRPNKRRLIECFLTNVNREVRAKRARRGRLSSARPREYLRLLARLSRCSRSVPPMVRRFRRTLSPRRRPFRSGRASPLSRPRERYRTTPSRPDCAHSRRCGVDSDRDDGVDQR